MNCHSFSDWFLSSLPALSSLSGRINVVELQPLLNVDLNHIEKKVRRKEKNFAFLFVFVHTSSVAWCCLLHLSYFFARPLG